MLRKQGRSIPPSRKRYEASHPVLSFRVTREVLAQIDSLRARGVSRMGLLLRGLGHVVTEQTAELERYAEGYNKGYEEARQRFAITFRCGACGGQAEVSGDRAKQDIVTIIERRGWRHGRCP